MGFWNSLEQGTNQGLDLSQVLAARAEQKKLQALQEQSLQQDIASKNFSQGNSLGFNSENLGLPGAVKGQGLPIQGPSKSGSPLIAKIPITKVPNSVGLGLMERKDAREAAQAGKGTGYENQFRDEFNKLSQPFQIIVPMYQNVVKNATTPTPTAQTDMGLIFSYMKMLDPNSTVREGEYATAANAGSIPDAIRNQFNKVIDGQKLQPEQRQGFAGSAKIAFESAKQQQAQHIKRYTDLSQRQGVNPQNVVYDYAAGMDNGQAPKPYKILSVE